MAQLPYRRSYKKSNGEFFRVIKKDSRAEKTLLSGFVRTKSSIASSHPYPLSDSQSSPDIDPRQNR